jgi:hypothetical protein
MKLPLVLLVASLGANAVLLTTLARRPANPPPAAPTPARPAPVPDPAERFRAALASGQARDLEAAGLDPAAARDLLLGRRLAALVQRPRAAGGERWWRPDPAGTQARDQLRRQLGVILGETLGDDAGLAGPGLDFLPTAKQAALRRIDQDYADLRARFGAGGIVLPSDQERLRLLTAERERDLAALLSPEERAAYDLRFSPSAAIVRARYGEGLETEEEFRRVFALQQAFDARFPAETAAARNDPAGRQQFADAQRQLEEAVRAALGEDAYARVRRARDGDLRNLEGLATRLNLPADTTGRLAAARENFAAASQRLQADASLPPDQRRARVQALATEARTTLAQTLGTEAAEAYARQSPWVTMLQGGLAFSLTPPADLPLRAQGMSVFPVLPAGANPAGAVRQAVITETAEGGSGGNRMEVRVLNFSTSGAAPAPNAPAPAGGPTILVPPPRP